MIAAKYANQLSTQRYGSKPAIEGVEIVQLPLQSDDGGNFSELARMKEGKLIGMKEPFEVHQMSMSVLVPGAIKAFHIHQKQDDVWYVPFYDRLLVNLHDIREGSKTFDAHMRLVMGGGKNFSLRIPKGVAHGVGNLYERHMALFYFTSQHFNPEDPDEHRLPWNAFGAEVWDITKG